MQKTKLALVFFLLIGLAWGFCRENNFPVAHASDNVVRRLAANDGTGQKYELRNMRPDNRCREGEVHEYRLFSSPDGGQTWNERGQQFNGNIVSIAAAYVDARSLYALVLEGTLIYKQTAPAISLYFSSDGGASWEKRLDNLTEAVGGANLLPLQGCGLISSFFSALEGRFTPVDYISFAYITRVGGSTGSVYRQLVSGDGGRSFNEVGADNIPYHHLDYFFTPAGLARYSDGAYDSHSPSLSLSADGGKSWKALTLPPYPTYFSTSYLIPSYTVLVQPSNAAGNLFLYTRKMGEMKAESYDQIKVWFSPDNGNSWKEVAKGLTDVSFTDYSPTEVTGLDNTGKSVKIEGLALDKLQTTNAPINGAAGGLFFLETRHNLWGPFKAFWETNGGIKQFGFPLTEPFREYNPADGQVYLAQYFERNRFEYHSENRVTPYEVELGLLGVQTTAELRSQDHGAFNQFSDQGYPGGSYFPETGHNLRNGFKTYWETNGGLTIYGYPISEEYYEKNPDDGQTYVVQYFERARFEWHPENQGTEYEVQLGLLGKELLREKGWSKPG